MRTLPHISDAELELMQILFKRFQLYSQMTMVQHINQSRQMDGAIQRHQTASPFQIQTLNLPKH